MMTLPYRSLLLASLLVGCTSGEEPEPPGNPDGSGLATLELQVDDASLRVNEVAHLTAHGRTAAGAEVALGTVTYATGDAAIATVDAQGEVTARGTGATTLRATSGDKSATVALTVEGGAVHSGSIAKSETWRERDNPHYVTSTLLVEGDAHPTLTLEPGVLVRFAAGTMLYVGQNAPASLKAVGSAEKPIQFVADTLSPTPGFWDGLFFAPQTGADTELRHATLSYCGVTADEASYHSPCMYIVGNDAGGGARPLIADVAISHSAGTGVTLTRDGAFAPGSARVSVSDGGSYAFSVDVNQAGTLPQGGTLQGNSPNAVNVRAGVLSRTQTWPNLGVPYVLTDRALDIEGANNPVLTLVAGTEVRVSHDSEINIGANAPGGLVAQGTAEAPVIFTAHSNAPTPGYWAGLHFWADALTTSRLSHATVRWAGSGGSTWYGNIMVDADLGAFITDTTTRDSAGCGIVRRNQEGAFTTDFSANEYGNSFASNAEGDQCGPVF